MLQGKAQEVQEIHRELGTIPRTKTYEKLYGPDLVLPRSSTLSRFSWVLISLIILLILLLALILRKLEVGHNNLSVVLLIG